MDKEERKSTNHLQCPICLNSMSSKAEYEVQWIKSTLGTVKQNDIEHLKLCYPCSKSYSLPDSSPKETTESHSEIAHITQQVFNYGSCDLKTREMSVEEKETYEKATVYKSCTKNPGHHNFIPVKELTLEKLPPGVQDKDILDCINLMSHLTVSLVTCRNEENTLCDKTYGTGSMYIPEGYQTCPCHECQNSTMEPRRIWVTTCLHVVESDAMARKTSVHINYDDDYCKETTVYKGHRLVNSDKEADRCILEFITHDIEFYERILNQRSLVRTLEQKLKETYRENCPNLAVIISHPHGLSKRVSIGSITEKFIVSSESGGFVRTSYKHNVPTCRGSSGSVVWILGFERVGYMDTGITDHTHSLGEKGNLNSSGQGLERDFPSITNITVYNHEQCHGSLKNVQTAE